MLEWLPGEFREKGEEMKIKVKTNFGLKGIEEDGIRFEGNPSLKDVVSELSEKAEFSLIYPNGEVDPDVEITLNGLEYAFLPQNLDTELKEDDLVEIMMLALGGG